MSRYAKLRERMVSEDLAGRGIVDPAVLAAFRTVPREAFVWDTDRHDAYADHPLRIGSGQTISQPYMVALMTQDLALEREHRILEVGTGSGYQCAILAEIAREVCTIERHNGLAELAEERLADLGYANVRFRVGDGTLGWPEAAPFDRIIVTAGAPDVPASLTAQLADAGRLVVPVGNAKSQTLRIVDRKAGTFTEREGSPCVFVKLVGAEGWDE